MTDANFLDFTKWFFSDPMLLGLLAVLMISVSAMISVLYISKV